MHSSKRFSRNKASCNYTNQDSNQQAPIYDCLLDHSNNTTVKKKHSHLEQLQRSANHRLKENQIHLTGGQNINGAQNKRKGSFQNQNSNRCPSQNSHRQHFVELTPQQQQIDSQRQSELNGAQRSNSLYRKSQDNIVRKSINWNDTENKDTQKFTQSQSYTSHSQKLKLQPNLNDSDDEDSIIPKHLKNKNSRFHYHQNDVTQDQLRISIQTKKSQSGGLNNQIKQTNQMKQTNQKKQIHQKKSSMTNSFHRDNPSVSKISSHNIGIGGANLTKSITLNTIDYCNSDGHAGYFLPNKSSHNYLQKSVNMKLRGPQHNINDQTYPEDDLNCLRTSLHVPSFFGGKAANSQFQLSSSTHLQSMKNSGLVNTEGSKLSRQNNTNPQSMLSNFIEKVRSLLVIVDQHVSSCSSLKVGKTNGHTQSQNKSTTSKSHLQTKCLELISSLAYLQNHMTSIVDSITLLSHMENRQSNDFKRFIKKNQGESQQLEEAKLQLEGLFSKYKELEKIILAERKGIQMALRQELNDKQTIIDKLKRQLEKERQLLRLFQNDQDQKVTKFRKKGSERDQRESIDDREKDKSNNKTTKTNKGSNRYAMDQAQHSNKSYKVEKGNEDKKKDKINNVGIQTDIKDRQIPTQRKMNKSAQNGGFDASESIEKMSSNPTIRKNQLDTLNQKVTQLKLQQQQQSTKCSQLQAVINEQKVEIANHNTRLDMLMSSNQVHASSLMNSLELKDSAIRQLQADLKVKAQLLASANMHMRIGLTSQNGGAGDKTSEAYYRMLMLQGQQLEALLEKDATTCEQAKGTTEQPRHEKSQESSMNTNKLQAINITK